MGMELLTLKVLSNFIIIATTATKSYCYYSVDYMIRYCYWFDLLAVLLFELLIKLARSMRVAEDIWTHLINFAQYFYYLYLTNGSAWLIHQNVLLIMVINWKLVWSSTKDCSLVVVLVVIVIAIQSPKGCKVN